MKKLKSDIVYGEILDDHIFLLCDAINGLPGLETFESCNGHGQQPYRIFFKVKESKTGLFFLTRCVDARYWKYGGNWKLELVVGDSWNGKEIDLPIYYMLHSNSVVGRDAYDQAYLLVDNMNYYLNHLNFMKMYDLDITKFNTFDDNESDDNEFSVYCGECNSKCVIVRPGKYQCPICE